MIQHRVPARSNYEVGQTHPKQKREKKLIIPLLTLAREGKHLGQYPITMVNDGLLKLQRTICELFEGFLLRVYFEDILDTKCFFGRIILKKLKSSVIFGKSKTSGCL